MLIVVDPTSVARRLRVRGVVQGVGFRPFVYRFANSLGLTGWVRNDGGGVEIEIQGSEPLLDAFTQCLATDAPPLARVDVIEPEVIPPDLSRRDFVILPSVEGAVATAIGPDVGVCPSCLAELFDPDDRRWRYPFINCTHCGPRYTITRSLPYDRARTSMAAFALCDDCAAEYHHPGDRRFHAEPNACPVCGPRLSLHEPHGLTALARDPLAEALRRIQLGEIVAIKGLGGFHLACDAANPEAVARLRERKRRPHQPLALMVANVASLAGLVRVNEAQAQALESPERPIVLLAKQAGCDAALPGIAPDLDELGVMLPGTPLHYLLFHEAAKHPVGTAWLAEPQPLRLVMTSANPHGEPLVQRNDEAFERLAEIADVLLMHDRDIVVRCDDSVLRLRDDLPAAAGDNEKGPGVQFLRRARGFTPLALPLGGDGPAVLAFGAHFKATLCLARGAEAFLSQHIGGLDNPAACAALDEAAEHLQTILSVRPAVVAHDAHPDYYSTRAALAMADALEVPSIAVQHHHAHIGAVCAEHRLDGPVLGFAADGVGLGTDGLPWGGELLWVDGAEFRRLGHLSPLALPGGDRAAREPWRVACGVLHALGLPDEAIRRFDDMRPVADVLAILRRGVRCPPTTSLGRWFDAAAGLLGVCDVATFEGHGAMRLETLAHRIGQTLPLAGGYHIEHRDDGGTVLNLYPLLHQLVAETDAERGASHFHATLIDGLAQWIAEAARATGVRQVALAGGCLLNRILASGLRYKLTARGLAVFEAQHVPPGDGGVALGQAWVARAQLSRGLL